MVDETEQLKQLLASVEYEQTLGWHVNRGCKIIALDPQIALALEMTTVAASGCSVAELVESTRAEPLAFNWFVAGKLAAFDVDDAQEHPQTVDEGGYPKSFLIGHLCEFSLLRTRPDEFEEYAKRSRIPQAKAYAKTVAQLFDNARKKAAK